MILIDSCQVAPACFYIFAPFKNNGFKSKLNATQCGKKTGRTRPYNVNNGFIIYLAIINFKISWGHRFIYKSLNFYVDPDPPVASINGAFQKFKRKGIFIV